MEEYIGMIQSFAGDYAPVGYALCAGQTLYVRQYPTLFTIIGFTYGGDGRDTFKLPDLRGRAIMGSAPVPLPDLTAKNVGDFGGVEKVELKTNHIPPHRHAYNAMSGNRESKDPRNNYIGQTAGKFYAKKDPTDKLMSMDLEVISPTGEGKEHENMAPFLSVNYIICIEGTYPVRE